MATRSRKRFRIVSLSIALLAVGCLRAFSQPASIDYADQSVVRVINTQSYRGNLVIRGSGSGIVIDDDGSVLTNAHVIGGGDKIFVHWKTSEGGFRKAEARVVKSSDKLDLALLQVASMDSRPISFSSGLPRKSSPVFALGFPGVADTGLAISDIQKGFVEATITQGVVSRLLVRDFPGQKRWPLVQHSAVISSGSSGGALINACGELIGVNVAVALDETEKGDVVSAAGFGFAIQSPAALDFAVSYGAKPSESDVPCGPPAVGDATNAQPRRLQSWSISLRSFSLIIASFLLIGVAVIYFLRRDKPRQGIARRSSKDMINQVTWRLDGRLSSGELVKVAVSEQSNPRGNPLLLGRDPTCTVRILDPTVSRYHAKLYVDRGELWCTDLNSSNGTRVGARRVSDVPIRIFAGTTLFLGNVALRVEASVDGEGIT